MLHMSEVAAFSCSHQSEAVTGAPDKIRHTRPTGKTVRRSVAQLAEMISLTL